MHRLMKASLFAAFGIVFAQSRDALVADRHPYRLEQSSSAIPLPAGIMIGEWTIAQWQNGLLVMQAATGITKDGMTNLVGIDRSGKIVFRHSVWIAGAASVETIGTAVSPSHEIAVSGFATSPGAEEVDFVQEIGADGSLLRQITTAGFLAFSLTYDDTGDLWIAGAANRTKDSWPDHNILRRYRNGQIQGEFLPYRGFLAKYEAATGHKSHPAMHGNEGHAFLLPLRDGVGVWSPGTHEWIEIAGQGTIVGRWQAPYPNLTPTEPSSAGESVAQRRQIRLTGLAVTSSGEVVASIQAWRGAGGFYRLDKASSSWQAISVASDSPELLGYVAGAEGASVVYRDRTGVGGWSVSPLSRD